MKSVIDIQIMLAKQWQQPNTRIERLLGDGLPIVLSIGRPKSSDITKHTHKVKAHLQDWQAFENEIRDDDDIYLTWETHTYRGAGSAIKYPNTLTITTAQGWHKCLAVGNTIANQKSLNKTNVNKNCGNSRRELAHYLALLNKVASYPSIRNFNQHAVDECDRHDNSHNQSDNKNTVKTLSETDFDPILYAQLAILLRQPKRVMALNIDTLLQLLLLANLLTPACANGIPLRSLDMRRIVQASQNVTTLHTSQTATHQKYWLKVLQASPTLSNLDSKFFATHHTLLTWLLDTRYQGMVSTMGLESFLQANASNQQWLMIYDSDYHKNRNQSWLPFATMQVKDSDLDPNIIPKSNILIIENEQCLHLLPTLPDTLVILGAGRNLAWLAHPDWAKKNLWYWGDIDTWGLAILSDARRHQASIRPVLMDIETLIQHQHAIVNEPTAYPSIPTHLTTTEQHLFNILRGQVDLDYQNIPDKHTNANREVTNIKDEGYEQDYNEDKETSIQSKRLEQEFIKADWVANALTSLVNNEQSYVEL